MSLDQLGRLESFVDEIADAVVVVSPDDVVLLWSRAAERMFGYSRERAVGASLIELTVPPDRIDEYRRHHQYAREHNVAVYESVRRVSDGRLIVVSVSVTAVAGPDGTVTHYVHSKRDVTLLTYRRDATLLEARFRGLLEAAPDSMVVVNRDGYILLVNDQAQQMFGYTRDELLAQPVETLVPDRFRGAHSHHRDEFHRDPRARPMGAELDLQGRRKDGSEFPVEISLSPLDSDQGPLAIAAIRDVTQQRALAERARLLVQEQAARFQAEEAVRTRNEFLSVAAHELKTPITSLRVFASLLMRQLEGGNAIAPERLRVALETIDQQADKLSRLINQLLDLSRLEAGRLGLSCERLDVMGLTRSRVEAARALTSRHQLALDGPAEVYAHVDGLRFEQVLTNLLDNAIKYSPHGGEIDVSLEIPTPGSVRLAVRDHGIGIPDEMRDAIFDRFYRVDEDGPTSGMGLGLFICRQIVELHGGQIEATSASGGGTRVTVTIPAHREESSA